MKRRMVSILLTASMIMGLCACGGPDKNAGSADVKKESASEGSASAGSEEGDSAKEASEGEYDQVTYAYSTFNTVPPRETLETVEEEINKITREKINAEITLKPIAFADYSSSVSLALQAGEKIDLFESIGDFSNCLNTDMAMDITDLAKEHAPDALEIDGEQWLQACEKEGRLYGIPTMKPLNMTPMIIYRKDIAEKAGLDMTKVDSYDDLTDIFRQVKEKCPEITPLCPVGIGDSGLCRSFDKCDYLSDDYMAPTGVLLGDETTVVDLYSSEEFAHACEMARTWYNEGLIMKDAATTTSLSAELMSSGNYFCYVASYSYPEEDAAASLEPQCGNYDLGAKILMDGYLCTATVNMVSWMVSSNSDVPEAALKFLNLTFCDKDIVNLLIYGIEGRDYVLDDEEYMSYPEGEDATTVPYTAQLSCGTLGNFFNMYAMAGSSYESLEWEKKQNETAPVSPVMGFAFDSSLKTQYTACKNVISQYLPGLLCGSVDPETEIPKFVSALNDAGYQDILTAKQEQLEAWLGKQ